LVLGGEIGLATDHHGGSPMVVLVDLDRDRALRGLLAGALRRLRLPAFLEDLDRLLDVAARFDERVAAVHHRSVGAIAQLLHVLGGSGGHDPPSTGSGPAGPGLVSPAATSGDPSAAEPSAFAGPSVLPARCFAAAALIRASCCCWALSWASR